MWRATLPAMETLSVLVLEAPASGRPSPPTAPAQLLRTLPACQTRQLRAPTVYDGLCLFFSAPAALLSSARARFASPFRPITLSMSSAPLQPWSHQVKIPTLFPNHSNNSFVLTLSNIPACFAQGQARTTCFPACFSSFWPCFFEWFLGKSEPIFVTLPCKRSDRKSRCQEALQVLYATMIA